ncbi:hypothetical protein [Bradyrhizobium elkanii]|uniref:hypothetical protein n=1 Tax=Bradyrhizobium elkanii TaxID=29448 RepID=UPI000841B49D|nr:hypothetical protein [Bradyrhizobium elkanii]ODM71733.1 hypothetical protein A6X20_07265 [Bradyrhizobium elkanii]ODM79106.1 hypothetical protein A6452_28850 [Bradyrhizobium elkanii]
MSNPLLLGNVIEIKDAGRGETPTCPDAKFKPGDIVKVRRTRALADFPAEMVILVAVPAGFPADYALADLVGEPRPLMIRSPRRCVTYILCEADKEPAKPYVARESDLLASGKPGFEIGKISRQ